MDKLESAISTLGSLNLSHAEKQDVFVPWKLQPAQRTERLAGEGKELAEPVYQRYYHLFKSGELREMVAEAARQELDDAGFRSFKIDEQEIWESGNWSIVACFRPRPLATQGRLILDSDKRHRVDTVAQKDAKSQASMHFTS